MKEQKIKFHCRLFFLGGFILTCGGGLAGLQAAVEAPNFNFNLDNLAVFLPRQKLTDLDQKFTPQILQTRGAYRWQKYLITQPRYQIKVLAQAWQDQVADFFAPLPSFFSHDVFLQALINLLGPVQKMDKQGEEAVYLWEQDQLRHIYAAACTITCFPVYYTVIDLRVPPQEAYQPLWERLQKIYR